MDKTLRALFLNRETSPSERTWDVLMNRALIVCNDPPMANWRGQGPQTDEQRRAMFARMSGGGSSPRASRWHDRDVLAAGVRGFFEGANDAAEKGLAKLSFGLTDKIGFTDSTRPELQWSGYDVADDASEIARASLITALGIKAGTAAWNAWKAQQAAATAAGATGARKFNSTGGEFWNNPGAWKSQALAEKLEAAQEKAIGDVLTKGLDPDHAEYIRDILFDKKDLFRMYNTGPVQWEKLIEAFLDDFGDPVIFNRLSDEQRKAIFAKRSTYAAGGWTAPKGAAQSGGGAAPAMSGSPGKQTKTGSWTPQGGFEPHNPMVMQAMADHRALQARQKQIEQDQFNKQTAQNQQQQQTQPRPIHMPAPRLGVAPDPVVSTQPVGRQDSVETILAKMQESNPSLTSEILQKVKDKLQGVS